MKIYKSRRTLALLSELLRGNQPFHYIRMGDGRILMAGGKWGGDHSDHFRNEKLIELLRKILAIKDSLFLTGLHVDVPEEEGHRTGNFANYKNNDELRMIVKNYTTKILFEHPAPMHYLALYEPDLIIDFFNLLRGKRVIFVGNEEVAKRMKGYDFIYGVVITPTTDAFEKAEEIQKNILGMEPDIVLTACGACSHILQYWTYQMEGNITTIDIGSFADLIVGMDTRQWIHDNHERVEKFIDLFDNNFKT